MADIEEGVRAKLDLYRKLMHLTAESAGLEWTADRARIVEISSETEEVRRQLALAPWAPIATINGLYRGCEELAWVWSVGAVDSWEFARGALDFLARELSEPHGLMRINNIVGLAHALGPAIVDPLFDLATDLLSSLRSETRRWESSAFDEKAEADIDIYAAPGEHDERFDEAPLSLCAADAECAGTVTIGALDEDAFAALAELIEQRDNAARRALRGEAVR